MVTIGIVGAIALFKVALDRMVSIDSPFLLFFSATIVCALYGGRAQGFFALILSLCFSYFLFIEPSHFFNSGIGWIFRFAFFTADCSLVVILCTKLRESRNKAKKALDDVGLVAQAQKFLDSVIENIPNMIFVKDAKDLRFVRFNKAGEKLVGYSRAELLGKNDYDLFPKEQADDFINKDRAVLTGNLVVDIAEEPIKTKYGTRYLHTKKIPLLDSDGKVQYLLGISEDITDKKASEAQRLSLIQEQLARGEAEKSASQLAFLSRASAALSESLDLNSMLTAVGKIVVESIADHCVVDLLDENTNEVRRAAFTYSDRADVSVINEYAKKFPVNKKPRSRTIHVIRTGFPDLFKTVTDDDIKLFAENEEHFVFLKKLNLKSIMVIPIRYHGKILGAISITSCHEERHYDELDLSIAEDLAKRIAFALENARLYLKAQEASKAKSEFLANMSHEIRTPLGAMLGFAELLMSDKKLTKDQRDYLSIISRNGNQLIRIVDEILDLSKVESEVIRLEALPFYLDTLMEEVTSLLKPQAENKKLSFEVKYLTQLRTAIISDPTRIRQILINIIGNAIKFTNQGGITITVNTKYAPGSSHKTLLEFKIEDTGIGISEEEAQKLFQPFMQADTSTTRKYGGTGLGLFLSRKLANLLGGDLVLDNSATSKGSTFIMTVEVDALEIPGMEKSVKTENTNDKKTNDTPDSGRVLIIDDVADNRTLLSYHVSRAGFVPDVAESGQVGIEKAMKKKYDVILMDVQMPEIDGFEAVRSLRSHHYSGPIVAVTAYAMKGDKEKCLESGFDDYLTKPVDKATLEKILMEYSKKATA